MNKYRLHTTKVSQYQNYPNNGRANFKHAGEDTFLGFVSNCMSGAWLPKSFWDNLRNEPDKAKRTELKTHIPAYTLSAYYAPGRKVKENFVYHTGLFVADIDPGDNEHVTDWPQLRDELFNAWPQVVLSCLSASGKGLFVVIALQGATTDNHKKFFAAISTAFKRIGITIDKSCSDVGRFRFLSYDPELKYRATIKGELPLPPEPQKKPIQKRSFHKQYKGTYDPFAHAVNAANKKWGQFTDGNKHDWINTATWTLKLNGVDESERIKFINDNYIDKSNINTNCLQ